MLQKQRNQTERRTEVREPNCPEAETIAANASQTIED